MIIRRAEGRDAAALSQLAIRTYTAAFGHSFGDSDLAAELGSNLSIPCFERFVAEDVVLIAELGCRVVGYIQFGAVEMPANVASRADRELRRVYVDPEFQGRGVGTLLMDAAFDHPLLREAGDVYLDVWQKNERAQRFYRQYGFEVIGERRFDVASGAATDPELVMVRRPRLSRNL